MPTRTRAPKIHRGAYIKLLAEALPRPIRSDAECARITARLLELDERSDELTAEERELSELLTALVEQYESSRYPIPSSTPNQALQALMEERGVQQKALAEVLGNKSLVSLILGGQRSISKAQAKKLADYFRAPVDLFI